MRGRVPRPREERVREGKTRNLPEPVRVSNRVQPGETAKPPMELNGAAARAFWAEVVPVLTEAGVIERIDLFMLALAANAWGDVAKAEAVLAECGYFQAGSKGQLREHSALKIKREATLTFERLANHLCLSPVARTRLGLATLTARAMSLEMDELLGGREGDPSVADAEVVGDDELVGLPGV